MMLGCTLPNRLLTGILTLRIGSQTNQPCSFQMVWISFQIAFRSARSSVVTIDVQQLIDSRLLRRRRLLLPHEPVVRDARRAQKFCPFAGIGRHAALRAQQDRVVLEIAAQVGDERVEIDRRQDDPDADLGEIVLDEVRRRDAHGVVGVGLQLKADRIAARVFEHAVAVAVLQPEARKQPLRLGEVVVVVQQVGRVPLFVARASRSTSSSCPRRRRRCGSSRRDRWPSTRRAGTLGC